MSLFCIFFTDKALMSSDERNPKSTLPIEEDIGCEIFILIYTCHLACMCGFVRSIFTTSNATDVDSYHQNPDKNYGGSGR